MISTVTLTSSGAGIIVTSDPNNGGTSVVTYPFTEIYGSLETTALGGLTFVIYRAGTTFAIVRNASRSDDRGYGNTILGSTDPTTTSTAFSTAVTTASAGGGVDYASPLYADDAPFWAEHGLLDKISETGKGGEFWMGWDEFLAVSGSVWANHMRVPLPHPQLPHAIGFDVEFTDGTAIVGNWPSVKSLRSFNQSRKITLTEETDVAISVSWQPGGSGPRHIFAYVTNGISSTELMPRGYGWWGGDGFARKTLPAGTYEITPACPDCTARGTVQFIVLGSKPISP